MNSLLNVLKYPAGQEPTIVGPNRRRVHVKTDFDDTTGDLHNCDDRTMLVLVDNIDRTSNMQMCPFQGDWMLDRDLRNVLGASRYRHVRDNMIGWYNDKRVYHDYERYVGINKLHSSVHVTVHETALTARHPGLAAVGPHGLVVTSKNIIQAMDIVDFVTRDLGGAPSLEMELHRIQPMFEPLALAIVRDFGKQSAWQALSNCDKHFLEVLCVFGTSSFFSKERLAGCR